MTRAVSLAVAAAFLASVWVSAQTPPPSFDILIANGRIVDGTGAPWYRADIGIRGDRIVAIGRLGGARATETIDARDLIVAPGFIDMLGQSEMNLLVDNRAASKLLQGVTTEITGEGTSAGPTNDRMLAEESTWFEHFSITPDWRTLADYFRRLERARPAINVGSFVGAGGVRDFVMGKDDRPPTPAELTAMKKAVADAMEQGALGLSTSLQYVPDRFATTDEIVELARVAASYGGVYLTHQRSEGNRIFESLDEVLAIAERANIPTEIWHLKTAYRANFGKMPEVLARIRGARARGLDVTANQYPYTRASNDLDACLPLWVREGSKDDMIARLKDTAQRDRIKADMADANATTWENQWYGSGGGDGVLLTEVINPALRQYQGLTLTEIGKRMGKDPRDAVMDLVVADRADSSVVISIMDEADVRAALADPLVSVGSDSGARAEDGPLSESTSHPRGWGSFPRILGKYVRDERLLTMEEAVRKMTSRPATRVGLADRGLIRAGLFADITVFDPNTIRDVATFDDPNHYSVGIRWVLVNGKAAITDGKITSARTGRVLKGPGAR